MKQEHEITEIISRRPLDGLPFNDPYDFPVGQWHAVGGLHLFRNQAGCFWADQDRGGAVLWAGAGDIVCLGRFGSLAEAEERAQWFVCRYACLRLARKHSKGETALTIKEISQLEADEWNRAHPSEGTLVGFFEELHKPFTLDRTVAQARYGEHHQEAVVCCEAAGNVPISMCSAMVEVTPGIRAFDASPPPEETACPHCVGTYRYHQEHCLCAILRCAPGVQLESERSYRRGVSQALHAAATMLRGRYGQAPLLDVLEECWKIAYEMREQPGPDPGYVELIVRTAVEMDDRKDPN